MSTTTVVELKENGNNEVKFLDEDDYDDDDDSILSLPFNHKDKLEPQIPDGGWGWMVVFAGMLISAVADGVSFSFGLLYLKFLDEFKASKSTTAWIGSLFLAVPLITGPIMSALVDKYGCRTMTIIGGIVSTSGFVLSAFAQSIGMMYFTFGILAGLGLGLGFVTCVVSIAFWFDKKRTLAVGLGACGSGLGTFIYAPMTQFFIEQYGWRGTTLLLAGGFLNMCVCGCLMRDPDWIIEQNKLSSNKSKSTSRSESRRSDLGDVDLDELKETLKSGKDAEYLLQSLETSMKNSEDAEFLRKNHNSLINLPTFIKQNERVPLEVLQQLSSNKHLYNVILENYPNLLSCRSTSLKGLNQADEATAVRVPVTFSMKLKKADVVKQDSIPEELGPLINNINNIKPQPPPRVPIQRVDSVPWLKRQFFDSHHYLKNMRFRRQSVMHRGAMLNIHKYRLRASSCPDIYRNSMITLADPKDQKWYYETLQLLKGMADFSLFKELHFLLMSLSTAILFFWIIIPYFYLADHLTKEGYTESDASFVLSTIGVTNTLGMIFLGWAGDQKWMDITKTYSICLILCGISTACMMFFTQYYVVVVISAACFGVFFASNFSFTPGILVELVPLERFTTSYGLNLMCQGIGHLCGPPVGGLLFDITESWEQSFYQAAVWIMVAGVLVAVIPFTRNKKILGHGPVEKELASERGSVI